MNVANEIPSSSTGAPEARQLVGRFVRRQGNYGTVAVVGRVENDGIDILEDPKRLFPRNGLVETQGVAHARLAGGDWIEFDVARNQRPHAHHYKVVHLRRLPRFAVLQEATPSAYRAMLTSDGWRGDRRAGLWALRISGDRVLVVELEAGKDGALRIPRKSAREVRWWDYVDNLVVTLPTESASEQVFLADRADPAGVFDWSDEADHVAQVIRYLSDANDPRFAELITWLELHHEEGTGRVSAGALDHDAAEAALRSGELAERLRADRRLMEVYLDAALKDDAVREAVAEWAREGHGTDAEQLREKLDQEILEERDRRTEELESEIGRQKTDASERLESEIERLRKEAFERVETEAAAMAEARSKALAEREREAEERFAAKLKELDEKFVSRGASLKLELGKQEEALAAARDATHMARSDLERLRAEVEDAKSRLQEASAETDRLLEITERLDVPARVTSNSLSLIRGITPTFIERPLVTAGVKGRLIDDSLLLTDKGKETLRTLVTLLMAGELPILSGSEVADLLRIAEAVLCPGRSATIEADPTVISIDDLWSRPGSGAPTAMAAAAAAAETGAVLVIIKGIERSGSRFWVPAIADALRSGSLPRGLFVCCIVDDREHEEIDALPRDLHWLEVEQSIADGAFLGAVSLLRPPALELASLDPGPLPDNLSLANTLIATLGFKPSLGHSMRIARIFVEARSLVGDDMKARLLTEVIAQSMSDKVS